MICVSGSRKGLDRTVFRLEEGDAHGLAQDRARERQEIQVAAGNWVRTASDGRVMVTDSTTFKPSRSREHRSSQAEVHRAGMFRFSADLHDRSRRMFGQEGAHP
jgi:hypothetical protein